MHHAHRYGWRYWQDRVPLDNQRGSTLASAAAAVAVAFAVTLATSIGLLKIEERVRGMDTRDTVHRWLGVSIARAAEPASAPLLIRSHQMPITVPAGTEFSFRVGFKNESGRAWVHGTPTTVLFGRQDQSAPSAFMASTWIDTLHLAPQDEPRVEPGAIAFVSARLRAPAAPGTTTETFVLRSLDGTIFADSTMEVTIVATASPTPPAAVAGVTIFGDGVAPSAAGTDGTDPNFIAFTPQYDREPVMRIGLDYSNTDTEEGHEHKIRSEEPFRIVTEDGRELATIPAQEIVAFSYYPESGNARIRRGVEATTVRASTLRLLGTGTDPVLEIVSNGNRIDGALPTTDSHFAGILEIRHVPETERLWIINELPIERYLEGLVETSDLAHPEFHKAQIIAARTFALYYLEVGGKYPKGQFILNATATDQVYKGEAAAKRRPNLVRAVEETRGIVATYDGDIAITPYYAQSDGRTRAYHDVWGGRPKAWLTSVPDPACEGRRLIGHGVGLAQRCAMTLATQGWTFQALLRHYYSGITLRKLYE